VVGSDAEDVVVADIYPGMGAVGGIRTGVSASASLHSLVVRADMPFLNAFLLRRLMELSTGGNL
jgi:molybdopterin-guanine dinucleotide biosynthesis protein A